MDNALDCPECRIGRLLKDGRTSWDQRPGYQGTQYRMAQQFRCGNCGTLVIIDFPKNVTVITKGE